MTKSTAAPTGSIGTTHAAVTIMTTIFNGSTDFTSTSSSISADFIATNLTTIQRAVVTTLSAVTRVLLEVTAAPPPSTIRQNNTSLGIGKNSTSSNGLIYVTTTPSINTAKGSTSSSTKAGSATKGSFTLPFLSLGNGIDQLSLNSTKSTGSGNGTTIKGTTKSFVGGNGTTNKGATTQFVKVTTKAPLHTTVKMKKTTEKPVKNSGSGVNGVDTEIKYGVVLVISFALVLLQIYLTVAGRRMRLHPIRWITLTYSCWNVFHLLMFSDASAHTPWSKWLADPGIVDNRNWLEMLTLTMFPLGMTMITPFMILQYAFPSVDRKALCQWMFWVPWLIILNVLPILLYRSYWWALDSKTKTLSAWAVPIEVYCFLVLFLAYVSIIYLLIAIIITLIHYLVTQSSSRWPKSKNTVGRSAKLVDLLLFFPLFFIPLLMRSAILGVNLATFAMTKLLPLLTPAPDNTTPAPGGGSGIPNVPMWVMNLALTILTSMEDLELFTPMVEVLLTIICVRMYREQYANLVTCHQQYIGDEDGAINLCCTVKISRKRLTPGKVTVYPAVQPVATMVAPAGEPVKWAQSVAPPTIVHSSPPSYVSDDGSIATSGSQTSRDTTSSIRRRQSIAQQNA
ncbi:hypothetical protein DdX_14485 [Ditylenchus destructor]|uniref:Transmembrane protein n=1 Tax=Ditylenchus destructor TaxID=166010 RepID=A0AAD4MUF9_9BILA|nr:hypothetical protein DdX_14485 [Ditylenchus destructor]